MNITILLVEDDHLIALDERVILQRNGYYVVHVTCGENALEYMEAHHDSVDLVLMDIDLGEGIDGPETARRLLASYTVPVTFLSSHTEREIVERTENITSYGYIVKNSGETVIIASIKMALRLFAARQELEVREKHLRWVTDSIEECFWVRSPDNRHMLYISPAYETIWHQSCASALERPDSFFDSVDSRDCSRVTQALREYKGTGFFHEDYRIRRPDGTVRWISARALPVLDAEGMVVAHTGVARDITREKLFCNELTLRDRELNVILGGLNEVVWSARWPDLDLILISPSIERLVGYQAKEFLERPQLWRGCFSRTDWNRLKETSTRILKEQVINTEIHIVTASQLKTRVRLRARIIKDDDGTPVRVAGSLTPLEALDELPVLPRAISSPCNESRSCRQE